MWSLASSKHLVYRVFMVTCGKAMFVVMQSIIEGKTSVIDALDVI